MHKTHRRYFSLFFPLPSESRYFFRVPSSTPRLAQNRFGRRRDSFPDRSNRNHFRRSLRHVTMKDLDERRAVRRLRRRRRWFSWTRRRNCRRREPRARWDRPRKDGGRRRSSWSCRPLKTTDDGETREKQLIETRPSFC